MPERRGAGQQRRQRTRQGKLGSDAHLAHHLGRGIVAQYWHGLRIDDIAGVRPRRHGMERRAGLALTVQHCPVDRRAAAILRQQRAVHVEGAARRDRQQLRAQQLSIVEREQEIGLRGAHLRHTCGRVGVHGRGHLEAMPARMTGDAVEPRRFVGRIGVRDHQRHDHALLQQHAQAAHADIVVGENDRAGHGCPGGRSSTAAIR